MRDKRLFPSRFSLIATILAVLAMLSMIFIVALQSFQINFWLGMFTSLCEVGFVVGVAFGCIDGMLLMEESAEDEMESAE